MVAVDVRQIEYSVDSIENCCKRLKHLCEEGKQACSRLNNLSGMSEIRRKLDGYLCEITEESMVLGQMTECLIQAVQMYESRELEIAEYAEEVKAYRKIADISQWYIPDWAFQIIG